MSVMLPIHKRQPRDKGGVAQVKFYKKKTWMKRWMTDLTLLNNPGYVRDGNGFEQASTSQ
jgi:hypothetical protein